MITSFHNQIGKACALAAATLILPVLSHAAQTTSTTSTVSPVPVHVPEGGPGVALLITTLGAIVLVSALLSSRKKPEADSK